MNLPSFYPRRYDEAGFAYLPSPNEKLRPQMRVRFKPMLFESKD
jgi:hypothetical protein